MKKQGNNNKYSKNTRSKRPFNKKDEVKTSSEKVRDEKYNDPSWYTQPGQLTKDVASISFNAALGAKNTLHWSNGDGDITGVDYGLTLPGIMTIHTVPFVGISHDNSSALNLGAKNFYSFIRSHNSGGKNYDSPDMMLYFGAMDSIYALIAYMMRAYGVARVFSQTNRYIGDALLTAMQLNPVEVRANLANFRTYINMYISKVSAFCTPMTMTLYKRHFWMYSGIYKDTPAVKSQMYMYNPAILYKYMETQGAGYLKAVPFTVSIVDNANLARKQLTLAELYSFANDLLAAVVSSEDINVMSGDILKAYGYENLWKLSMIDENYAVMPVYSKEVNDQIHNSRFAGQIPTATLSLLEEPTCSLDRLNIIQDPEIGDGALYCVPQFKNASHLAFDPIVDSHSDNPTPEEIIVATRNIITGHSSKISAQGSTTTLTTIDGAGTDLCLWADVWRYTAGGTLSYDQFYRGDRQNYASDAGLQILSHLSKFTDRPIMTVVSAAQDNKSIIYINGEIDNFAVLSKEDVHRMHDTAVLSQLGVPFLGTAER